MNGAWSLAGMMTLMRCAVGDMVMAAILEIERADSGMR